MVDGYGRTPARIAQLEFTYADPAVDVTTEQRTVEHETVDDRIVVQTLGRKPDQIKIDGVVPAYELDEIDALTELGVTSLRTQRWEGDVIIKSTNTTFKRARAKTGDWLYDVSITCIEVDDRTEAIEEAGASSSSEEESVPWWQEE